MVTGRSGNAKAAGGGAPSSVRTKTHAKSRLTLEEAWLFFTENLLVSTASNRGTAGLPLPSRSRMFPTSATSLGDRTRLNPSSVGERVGVRGFGPIDSL